uniref:Glycoprotein endo-alpha-1,2-mannosidase n=1 Tax=Globodera rostochiensis TaxID=31243 RepID=A0A914GZS2_GLORO
MKLVQMLKLCVCVAFIASIITGTIFMMHSSADERGGKQIKVHEDGIVNDAEDVKARFPEEQKPSKKFAIEKQQHGDDGSDHKHAEVVEPPQKHPKNIKNGKQHLPPDSTATPAGPSSTIEQKVLKELKSASAGTPPSIHIFYYPWYGSPAHNGGRFYHWNHRYLPGWKPTDKGKFPTGAHVPPGDIASVYYPSLGPYSSWDAKVIERHMKWMSSAGIDVVVCSWYPRAMADPEGTPWDSLMPTLLNATDKAKMKMAFHLEPYDERTVAAVRRDIAYILEQYGHHPALYRRTHITASKEKAKELPVFYVYDSYRIKPDQWATVLGQNGTDTIRGTNLDALLIGLYVDKGDAQKLMDAAFDGLYTYFAADGFSHGSTMANWPDLSAFCARNKLLFVPSVGPGYNDTRVRPWNSANAHNRAKGEYYREHFKMAHTAKADIVSITSFNEWHEGTQIEPAVPFTSTTNGTSVDPSDGAGFVYAKYDGGPEQYLEITLEMVKQYFTAHHEDIPAKIAPIV